MSAHKVVFHSQARTLQGTLCLPPREARGTVILCHGFGSYAEDIGAFPRIGDRLAQAGFASLWFSFSGSQPYADAGTIRPASEWVADCLNAVRFLSSEETLRRKPLGLLGLSVGGGVVIQAAALDQQVRCVVALAPVADGHAWLRHRWTLTRGEKEWQEFERQIWQDVERVARGETSQVVEHFDVQAMPDREQWEAILDQYPLLLRELSLQSVWDTFHFRPLNYVQDVAPRPLRIVWGDSDESVPITQGYELYGRAGQIKDLQVVSGAPHCPWDTPFEDHIIELSLEWFSTYLGTPLAPRGQ